MVPKVEGPWDIHYVDRLLAQLEAKAGLERPILVHAILETSLGVTNLEDIATASPRMQGMSFGPADLAASRRMKTTRVGGGHPGYRVDRGPRSRRTRTRRAPAPSRTRGTTRSRAWSTPARPPGSCPSTAPTATSRTSLGCETQFRAAFLLGCVGAWSLHPAQIDIAKKVFSPDPDEVAFAKKVIEAIPDGAGVHMIDGKMQDDATWKQCRVMVDLAELLAAQGPRAGRGLRVHATGDRAPRDEVLRVRGARDRQARRASPSPTTASRPRPQEAREIAVRIGEPVVIKSQVLTGGRMKAGGVQFADTPDEAAAKAEHVLGAGDQRPHAARRARRPQGRASSRSTTPASCGTGSASSR